MSKRWFLLIALVMLIGGGIIVGLGEKSKARVGLGGVMEVVTDAQRDLDRVAYRVTRVSDEEEMAFGREISGRAIGWFGGGPDAAVASYVAEVGAILAANVKRPGIRYTFRVIDSPQVNAFAMPGGQVFILRGLLDFVESESELAMVIGHEIAHVDLRHCIELFQHEIAMKKIAGAPTDPLGALRFVMVRSVGTIGVLVHRVVSQGYRQFQEFDADAHGWSLATQAGYDPEAGKRVMARLSDHFARLERQAPPARTPGGELIQVVLSAPDSYFRSHPPTRERIERFTALLNQHRSQFDGRRFIVGRENLRRRESRRRHSDPDDQLLYPLVTGRAAGVASVAATGEPQNAPTDRAPRQPNDEDGGAPN